MSYLYCIVSPAEMLPSPVTSLIVCPELGETVSEPTAAKKDISIFCPSVGMAGNVIVRVDKAGFTRSHEVPLLIVTDVPDVSTCFERAAPEAIQLLTPPAVDDKIYPLVEGLPMLGSLPLIAVVLAAMLVVLVATFAAVAFKPLRRETVSPGTKYVPAGCLALKKAQSMFDIYPDVDALACGIPGRVRFTFCPKETK